MNIYVYNCPNTFNYGSMMMGENFVSYFNKITGEKNNYFVETDDEVNITRLREATEINEIYPVLQNSLFKEGTSKKDYICGYLRMKNIISDFIKKIDLVVVLGGDDFTEDYGWKRPIVNGIRFNILKREGLKVVMLGQTMGPYESFRKPVMKYLLSKIDKIYPRDPITYKYLDELGLKNIAITDDLALLTLSKQEEKKRTKEFITYCPSELIYRFSKEGKRPEWIDFNLFMIDKIMEKYPDKKVVILAHVIKPETVDDRIIANELFALVKNKYKNRIIIESGEMFPYQVRNYIQQSLITISSRMHPVVSSIQCETPAIALSYSSKYWGIIGERYGLGDYIIDVRHLTYDEMKSKFVELLNVIDSQYDKIQKKMSEKNKLANETIMKTLKEISGTNF
ncbi:polysaccharide pyruvyl transferase family protein [Clostridium algoriphilum]|uniref:polysaccharide pyruvyl transferase family protein n=1 Tax=Clostridium algoriphilum TaxID=198347 RepID=UPI001CF176D7|nr:polysaccharide pyruvyl transferase family protein [Clostridium algoriphilum]MCB2293949.1 polysaccharide pyruvyl transferase family protein [Clostridium algoriphilum]